MIERRKRESRDLLREMHEEKQLGKKKKWKNIIVYSNEENLGYAEKYLGLALVYLMAYQPSWVIQCQSQLWRRRTVVILFNP